jgi:hypothetical protein
MGIDNFIRNYIPGLSKNIYTITNFLSSSKRKLELTEKGNNAFHLLNETIQNIKQMAHHNKKRQLWS